MVPEKTTASCDTTAIFWRSAMGSSWVMSMPSNRMLPLCASKKRSINWKTVDLPAPLGPTSATASPLPTSSEKLFSALKPGRAGYWKVTFSNRTAPPGLGGNCSGLAGGRMAGTSCSNSISRSDAPAARCRSPQVSLSAPTPPPVRKP